MRARYAQPSTLILALSLFQLSPALASDQIGTLTQLEGDVKIFSHPGKTIQGPAPHALYEGQYFSVKNAKTGDRVEKGNVVRTLPGGKARVVFDNGDQYNIGSGTAFKVTWDKDAKDGKSEIDLMYGKLRGIVTKGGPRSRLTVRTRSATMGVRGTDFFIAEGGNPADGTEIAILRGAVEVKPSAAEAKPVEVKAGYSLAVQGAPAAPEKSSGEKAEIGSKAPAKAPTVELRQTTQEELKGIQKSSEIKKVVAEDAQTQKKVTELVQKLESKAVEASLNDIKHSDPLLYAKLQEAPPKSADEANQHAVQKLIQVAPKAPEKHKPYKSELDDLEGSAYQKYFKNFD